MVSAGIPNMQMVNLNNLVNVKDSRWLQLEVCREFQRNKCTRPDTECKFAHPPATVEVQNGRVTACYDSIKGRCQREKPPCKYFHPPQHLKDQLLINGRNHLALKNAFMTQIQGLTPGPQLIPGTVPVDRDLECAQSDGLYQLQYSSLYCPLQGILRSPIKQTTSPYVTGVPMTNFNPYVTSHVMAVGVADGAVASPLAGVVPQAMVTQKVPRTDRLEAFPGMGVVPYKRPAAEKSGVPVYQPAGSAAYHQAVMQQLGSQTYVPVSCEYGVSNNLLALPGPNADSSAQSPPANHSIASSSHLDPSPSSSSTASITSSTTTTTATLNMSSSTTTSTSTNSSSLTGKLSAQLTSISLPSNGACSIPPPPVATYAGYALSKGIRGPVKSPAILSSTAVAASSAYPPSMQPLSFSSFGYGVGSPVSGYGMQLSTTPAVQVLGNPGLGGGMTGLSSAGFQLAPGVAGMGAGVPVLSSHPLVYSQYPASSLYLPQITALSSNPQYSLAQTSEQPLKKLKTS